MCKQCELKGIKMTLSPLNIGEMRKTITLPKSWHPLEAAGFNDDLLTRAYAHMAWTERTGNEVWIGNARAFLSAMAKGFAEPFDRTAFDPKEGDPHFDLKRRGLDAVEELSDEFGDRVSSVVWDSFAHMATRSEPEVKTSILKETDTLPHHYGIVDCMYHAAGKVYTFILRVQSVFFRHTGMVLVHNCDCQCSLLNLRSMQGAIQFDFTGEKERFEATQSLFVHQCAESHLILNCKLPFEYTITKEAQELFGVETGCAV
jgi:hypothetical protein